MLDVLRSPVGQAIFWFAVLLVLSAIAFYLVARYRGKAFGDEPTASELMTRFRQLHERGMLTDEEFRGIKRRLGQQIQAELNASKESD